MTAVATDVTMPGVLLEGVVTSHAGRPPVAVLRGVDLIAPARRFTAVLGPSGCGKTTLLRVIAGLQPLDAGTIIIDGRVVSGQAATVPPERRRVAIVPQEGALFPHLDVAGNVGFGLRRLDRARARTRVGEMLELVGLAGYERRRPDQLSGGQQQRVALARALAPEPHVVLLDEPFAALDTGLRTALRTEVAALLADAGATSVLVTHDQDEALALADQVAILRDGVIAQSGSPEEVYRRPVDLGVARTLGDVVVLPGRARAGRVECALGSLARVGTPTSGPVVVVLRPEQIRIAPAGGGSRAMVRSVAFHGHEVRVSLDLGDHRLVARCAGPGPLSPGTAVDVTVVGPVLTFPTEPARAAPPTDEFAAARESLPP